MSKDEIKVGKWYWWNYRSFEESRPWSEVTEVMAVQVVENQIIIKTSCGHKVTPSSNLAEIIPQPENLLVKIARKIVALFND